MARVAGGPALPVFVSTASTALVALTIGLAFGRFDPVPSWPAHGWLVLLGLTGQALGYLAIATSLPRLPAVVASIILLAQPVGSVGLGIVLLGEAPSPVQLAGVGLVLVGIAVASGAAGRIVAAQRVRAAVARRESLG